MKRIFLFLTFLNSISFAMLGGFEVKPNDLLLSSFVKIYTYNKDSNLNGFCTGTIVGKKSVLTAAHCLKHLLGSKNYEIILKATHVPFGFQINPLVQKFRTKKFSIYENYLNHSDLNERGSSDLAIITLEDGIFWLSQKPLPIISPGSIDQLPNTFQIYASGDPDLNFRKQNFNLISLDKFQIHDPLNFYTGVNGGFFLVDHPETKLLPGDSGCTALAYRFGRPTVVGVLSGRYTLNGNLIGYSFANLNNVELNKWVRSQIR